MASGSATRASLLLKIRDPYDGVAWREFVELYAPLIHAYGMRCGLQDADAANLVQEVLRTVCRTVPQFEYDRSKGSFRGWLLAVTRNAIYKSTHREKRQAIGSGDSRMQAFLAEQPDDRDERHWEHDYRWSLFHWAADKVQGEFRKATWQAFWQTVVEQRSIEQVASELGVTAGAVYIARSRVTARIREQVALADSV